MQSAKADFVRDAAVSDRPGREHAQRESAREHGLERGWLARLLKNIVAERARRPAPAGGFDVDAALGAAPADWTKRGWRATIAVRFGKAVE